MRTILLALASIPLFISPVLQAQPKNEKEKELLNFPRYGKIVRNFFGHYAYENSQDKELQFARKPDGWYTYETDPYHPDSVFNEQLFWSLKDGIHKLNYPDAGMNGTDYPAGYMDLMTIYSFERIPYYGYKGWANDVVNNFHLNDDLSDTSLEGLARAHMNIATEIIDPRALTAYPTYSNISEEEKLRIYNLHSEAEIETYMKLKKINPNYETFVGDIFLKIGNEIMDHYFQLSYYGREKEVADKYFKEEIYPRFYIDIAKNYLMSCARNAVLFSNGDSDTYPLWYVQAVLGFRTDVEVINISLLNGSRYYKKILTDAKPFPFQTTLSASKYANGKREFAYCKEQSDTNYFSAVDVLNYLASDDTSKQTLKSDKEYYSITPGKNIILKTDPQKIKEEYELNNEPSYTLENAFKWKLKKSYILKSDIIILDLLANNISKRPFYFTSTTDDESLLGLSDHLLSRCMTLAIVPVPGSVPADKRKFDARASYDLLMNKYIFSDIRESGSEGNHRFIQLYRTQLSSLAGQFNEDGKKKEALALLDRSAALFPISNNWIDVSLNYDVFQYYQLGETKKAIALTEKLAGICSAILQKQGAFPHPSQGDVQNALRLLPVLQEQAHLNKQEGLAKKIGAIYAKYGN